MDLDPAMNAFDYANVKAKSYEMCEIWKAIQTISNNARNSLVNIVQSEPKPIWNLYNSY